MGARAPPALRGLPASAPLPGVITHLPDTATAAEIWRRHACCTSHPVGAGLAAAGADDPRIDEIDREGGAIGGDDRGGEPHPDLGGGESGPVRLAADPFHLCEEGEQGVVETIDGGG